MSVFTVLKIINRLTGFSGWLAAFDETRTLHWTTWGFGSFHHPAFCQNKVKKRSLFSNWKNKLQTLLFLIRNASISQMVKQRFICNSILYYNPIIFWSSVFHISRHTPDTAAPLQKLPLRLYCQAVSLPLPPLPLLMLIILSVLLPSPGISPHSSSSS